VAFSNETWLRATHYTNYCCFTITDTNDEANSTLCHTKITNLTVAFGNADPKVITATLSKSNSILLGAAE